MTGRQSQPEPIPPEIVAVLDGRAADMGPFVDGLVEWYRRVATNYGSSRARIAMSVLMHDHFTEKTKGLWIDSLIVAVGRLSGGEEPDR